MESNGQNFYKWMNDMESGNRSEKTVFFEYVYVSDF